MKDSRKGPKLPWGDKIDDDHYDDAYDYLSLHWLPAQAGPAVNALRAASLVHFYPGDLLRAAKLEPLGLDDTGVRRELTKALSDGEIEPLLCINLKHGIVIADGFHRASLAYHLAPFHKVPLKLAPSERDSLAHTDPL